MEPREDDRADRSNGEGHSRRKRSNEMHPRGNVVYTRLSYIQTKHGFGFVDVGESKQSTSTSETTDFSLVLKL